MPRVKKQLELLTDYDRALLWSELAAAANLLKNSAESQDLMLASMYADGVNAFIGRLRRDLLAQDKSLIERAKVLDKKLAKKYPKTHYPVKQTEGYFNLIVGKKKKTL